MFGFCAFYQNVLDWVLASTWTFWGGSSLRIKEWVRRVCPMRSRVRLVSSLLVLLKSLYSEAYELSLKLRIIKLGLQYYCKLKSLPTNLAHDSIFYPKQQSLFDQKEKTIKPFGLRMKHILEETDISLPTLHDTIHLSSPPWLLKQPVVILDLNKLPKSKTYPLIYQEKLNKMQEIYPNYQHIFTDSSKSNYGTGCEAVLHKKSKKKCLPKEASYFLRKSML